MILGIDIGGANTKITEMKSDGTYKIHHIYFPMWRNNKELTNLLAKYNHKDITKIALVMTAELADSYETKKEGVIDILNSVKNAFPNKEIFIFDVDGNFLTPSEAVKQHIKVSASNWTATAEFVKNNICPNDNCILIDMGSTTTDIIPIVNGKIVAQKTDLDRLINNELLYVGTLRTPISFLSNTVEYKCKNENTTINVSSEYFAITGDINIIMDKITTNDYTCDTPDGAPTNKQNCKIRLSKVLCGDLEQIGEEEINEVAKQFYAKLLNLIKSNVDKVATKYNINNIVITGLGEPILIDALRQEYNIISIKEGYNKDVSLATPSFAVAELLNKTKR
ncbi:Hydantoinase/oxoprolinase [Methanococcus aeolicus Nankai-3]|uniref:Hydantoinase/oxoprolinase n=1 Tax=Methanococcus aeolicus (strain ATCC BAA-1280 / DSM 17508 / OCM 812 / Nankai-3) TaxID=419665 RepID=A6UUN5_META3|nr:(4-{4-[2-(gamma-L-glutamylamino)ethyl]phenoxymethyl}furan-2-yl)methanamine synthase [Methanococcus aeolicus]ABR56207.1 Hydantoinase/oxoprolinase [Methanococcus aeolicus Nankai-3]